MFVVVWLRPQWSIDLIKGYYFPKYCETQSVVADGMIFNTKEAAWDWINSIYDYEDKNGYAFAYTVRELI